MLSSAHLYFLPAGPFDPFSFSEWAKTLRDCGPNTPAAFSLLHAILASHCVVGPFGQGNRIRMRITECGPRVGLIFLARSGAHFSAGDPASPWGPLGCVTESCQDRTSGKPPKTLAHATN
jgi:hypothetical protein